MAVRQLRPTHRLYIVGILRAYNSYDNDLPYDPTAGDRSFPYSLVADRLPPITPGVEHYNSNSFVSGLLVAAGKDIDDIPNPANLQPGLDKPIPLTSTYGVFH